MKERLDVLLVKQGFAPSREKAKAILMSGIVYVDGQKEDKAGPKIFVREINEDLRTGFCTLKAARTDGMSDQAAVRGRQRKGWEKGCCDR